MVLQFACKVEAGASAVGYGLPVSRPANDFPCSHLPPELQAGFRYEPPTLSCFSQRLGDPAPNSVQYFASCVIEKLRTNPKWLDKITRTLARWWQRKNSAGAKASGGVSRITLRLNWLKHAKNATLQKRSVPRKLHSIPSRGNRRSKRIGCFALKEEGVERYQLGA